MKKYSILVWALIMCMMINMVAFAEGDSDSIVSATRSATYVIKDDGSLWGWGSDYIGNGSGEETVVWQPVKVLDQVRSVSVSAYQRAAVTKDHSLWVWGYLYGTYNGQSQTAFTVPTKVLTEVEMVSVSEYGMIVLKQDGSVWVNNLLPGDGSTDAKEGFVKVMDGVKYVATGNGAGYGNAYVIKSDDTLWGWGDNVDVLLGNGNDEPQLVPIKILDDVRMINAGSATVMAVRLDNSLYSWGAREGRGILTETGWVQKPLTPYKVMDNVLMAKADFDGKQMAVLKTDYSLWAWGEDNQFVNSKTPVKLYERAREMAVGRGHIAVVFKDNTLGTAGNNFYKVLAHGDIDSFNENVPLQVILTHIQDVPASWAVQEVEEAIGRKLVPDDMQSNYDAAINRKEFCILLIRMVEEKTGMSAKEYILSKGIDIPDKSPFSDCDNINVTYAYLLDIFSGTSPTTFSPDQPLTREQGAKVLSATARALGANIEAKYPGFNDDKEIAEWSKPYIGYVYDANIMKGVGQGIFGPKNSYQRQQAIMTVLRLLKGLE